MENLFIRDLGVVICVAAATTLLCRLLRQPVVIGYLIAGLIVGPHTPPFSLVADLRSIQTMAELGLVVLMFVLGLEFSLPKLKRVGLRALSATTLEIIGMLALGFALGQAFGWSMNDSVYLGAILSISSTTIIIRVLTDLKLTKELFAQAVFGILILEDVAAVVILTVLSGLGAHQASEGLPILRAIGGVAFFVALFLIIGLLVVPRLLRWIARFQSREMTGLAALALCLTGALLAEHFGFSTALGAFMAGAVIGVSPEVEPVEEWIHPIRDLFSALFFVSAGLLIDPRVLWEYRGPVAVITVVTVIGKMAAGAVGSWLAGYPPKTASRIGMTLAQIGEFSFVFAALGVKTGTGSAFLYPIAVAVSALTTLFTPYLIRYSDPAVDALMRRAPARFTRLLERENLGDASTPFLGSASRILSRYLWRLGIYLVLLTTGFLLTKAAQTPLSSSAPLWAIAALWILSWTLQLPLIHAAATYVNHFLLLVLTELAARSHASSLLQRVPIQAVYDAFEGLIWIGLAILWITQANVPIGLALSSLAVMGAGGWAFRRWLRRAYEKLEILLDEILGLASSEPLRRAALVVESSDSLLSDAIERVVIGRKSPVLNHSLRETRLREQTGASVIGIYRDGVLNSNPSPETVIKANDILVVLGDNTECAKARKALLGDE
jgi:CPA2 family monovalent cation:H+ antiporter-2